MTSEVAQDSTQVLDEDRWVDPELVALAHQAAAEGIVLLRNEDALPLPAGEKVALFGRVQLDWVAVGYGSGGDVNAPYETNLLDSLSELGTVEVDQQLAETYRSWCAENVIDHGDWGNWPWHYAEMPIADEAITAASERNRTAVVVVARAAGEDRENSLEPGSFYLTDDEKALLERVTKAFERTVVIVDSGNVMDLAWVEEVNPAGVVFAWLGGMEGAKALAEVLVGQLEPGGRLTDTIAWRYEDYPSAENFGGHDFNNYAEDVYVGYRFFETFAPEKVQYPFGFGLGYTDFEVSCAGFEADDQQVRVRALVTNTGERSGREVVQLYLQGPAGTLGRPARELVAFAKSDEVEPGASVELELVAPLSLMAAYDDQGSSGHPFAFVLEAGEYAFHLGMDVRRTVEAGSFELAETILVEQCEQAAAVEPDKAFERIVARRDGETYTLEREPVPTSKVDLAQRILDRLPEAVEPTGDKGIKLADVASGKASLDDFVAQLAPEDLAALTYGDVVMDSELGVHGNAGAFGGVNQTLRDFGIPPVITTDGPSGIRVAAYTSLLPIGSALAASWNPELVHRLYTKHGEEMLRKGSDILLAPGMNIHRDPLGGRNFEYYSEDPLITGKMGAAVVAGIQGNGVSACPKHFACNSQEVNRIRNDSRVSERALREIYLKGFRICVEEAAPQNIMTSYNLVNGVWAHYHYDLVTTILRGEWGYAGNVMTDWWMRKAQDPNFPALQDSAYRVRAQVDVLMPGAAEGSAKADTAIVDSYGTEGGITLGEMQRCARNVLSFLLASGRLERGPVNPEPRAKRPEPEVLDGDSTFSQWLDSERGGPVVREMAEKLGMTEDEMAMARGAKMRQVVAFSKGRITDEDLADMIRRVNG